MEHAKTVGFLLYDRGNPADNAFNNEMYQGLATYFVARGINVQSIAYHDEKAAQLTRDLRSLDYLLVWVNPIEQGGDRQRLDRMLRELSTQGLGVSTHPDTIMKIGTKRVLYDTRAMTWGSAVKIYESFADFQQNFIPSLAAAKIRVLKQLRGDGGNGVYKVSLPSADSSQIAILHARRGSVTEVKTIADFFQQVASYFAEGKPLLDQPWHEQMQNGVVRCYLSSRKVVGFGYQEINALYPGRDNPVTPGKRYYYTENCGLFRDLKARMEEQWLDELAARFALDADSLPVIWDADFFINDVASASPSKYTLCEINVSCVSPFPESAIPHIYAEVQRRLG